jgi:DNA polymerase
MREWVLERVGPQAKAMMMVWKDGVQKASIDKTVRGNLLAMENPDEVPAEVAEVVQCADDLWASSVAKFERAASLADDLDSRVRGAFVFAGGSATGRASSYGLQVHNFPRKCARDPELARQALVRGHQIVPEFGKRVTDVLKSMLRPALIPAEGKSFAVFDYAQIEARVTPWLSMHGEETLDVFREGRDIYVAVASRMFNVQETAVADEQRQLGKVAVLACGFGGGVGAFSAMGRVYGVHMPESEARRTVDLWRRANPWAVPFWSDLEHAYTRAIRRPGEVFKAGRVQYMMQGEHLWYALPSGRVLCYPYARFEEDGVSYAKASWKPAADAKEWPRARLWKGLACENIVQATANDILREALRELDAAGVEVVLHVHDEIVAEIDTDKSEELAAAMRAVMVTPPAWAEGLPLGASGKVMQRYGK